MLKSPVLCQNLLGPLVTSIHLTAPFPTLSQSPKPWDSQMLNTDCRLTTCRTLTSGHPQSDGCVHSRATSVGMLGDSAAVTIARLSTAEETPRKPSNK